MAKPTWLTVNENIQDPELVLQSEAQEGDGFIPRDGFLLGSPLESAINLYKELQQEYQHSVQLHPHNKVWGFLSVTELLWSQLVRPGFMYGPLVVNFAWAGWTLPN